MGTKNRIGLLRESRGRCGIRGPYVHEAGGHSGSLGGVVFERTRFLVVRRETHLKGRAGGTVREKVRVS